MLFFVKMDAQNGHWANEDVAIEELRAGREVFWDNEAWEPVTEEQIEACRIATMTPTSTRMMTGPDGTAIEEA